MIVYIDESAGSQNEREVLVALCAPREADIHLSPFLFKLKKEIYEEFAGEEFDAVRAVEVKASKMLKPSRFEAAIRGEVGKEKGIEARDFILIDEIFQNLASNPAFERVVVFAGVMEGRKKPNPGELPLEYFYLLQRIDRLVECEYPERVAYLHFDRSEYNQDRILYNSFSSLVHGFRKRGQFTHIHPTPFFVDSKLTPGIELADLVAGVIRIAYENGLGWQGMTEKSLEELSRTLAVASEPYLSRIQGYYRVLHSKTRNWLKSNPKLFGIYLLSQEQFASVGGPEPESE